MKKNGKKILIIEDEPSLREALNDKFSQEGFEVEQAPDGELGLSLALGTKPDLILLDIIMPKLDGISMLEQLREDERGKHIPVIILTNLSDNEKLAKAMELGSHDYLVKTDWKLEDVVKKVKEKIGL